MRTEFFCPYYSSLLFHFITKKLFTGGASRLLQIGVSTISVSYSSIFSTCVTNAGRISLSNSCRARAVTSLYTEE
ncbi:hypothetical protein NSB1T_09845 [Coprobacter fastidiosus NSB1 = JCM 33896]|nr:hypothetical protein [Coprobacter fastidiosus]ERM90018.1 hypothetical protein NSB1T_09845 [Coprobacter fastidiosus NSB1 = JCM 33896]